MSVSIEGIYRANTDIIWGDIILLDNFTLSSWTTSFQDIGSGEKLRLDTYDLGTTDYPQYTYMDVNVELLKDSVSIETIVASGTNYVSLTEIVRFDKLFSDFDLNSIYQFRISLNSIY